MKLIVFFVFVISNISNDGKASLESFAPSNDVNFLTDTTKSSDKSCHRPCKFNVKPRRCYYKFDIEPTVDKIPLTVNGQSPGPPIHVCIHDIIVVEVRNKIPDQDLAIHWHGLEQRGTPYMDGVPMITQCPISYGSTFKYAFKASSPGTFFYHADSVTHQSDGVYGSLIVEQPQPLEPHSSLYDFNRREEHTLVIGARFPQLLSGTLEDLTKVLPDGLVINGQDYTKIFVMHSYAYRLRLINAIALECPVLISIDGHMVTVVASDGKPVQPVTTSTVRLYPGERMDIVVRADQPSGGYWLQVEGENQCDGLKTHSMFLYQGFNYTSMIEQNPNTEVDKDDIVFGQKLISYKDVTLLPSVKSVYLGIDKHSVEVKDADLDFRYLSDVVPKKPFFPTALSLKEGVVQINGRNFLYPNAPLLMKPRDVFKDIACSVETHKHKDVQCLQILRANQNEQLELILVNEGVHSNDSYTFHMHGLPMYVVATWQSPAGLPLSKEEFEKLDRGGLIERNLQNPPMKDTVTVPNKGFTIVRINPDHGGHWLLECRSCSLTLPAAILISVPITIPKTVVDSLPSCGSYKPPDVLLN
ncbi:L-ascorbate oxidase-like [Pieris brassicae]|uniref:Uncharacterized protein n=1 Tax=Pieris brassicae TaxID=7116 RepID=A0A9P0TRR5_PIEBR|nr:L-ascorbate oxidase-like [Pieris brassicae]CAH4037261.1 unnamed protein product [Pieris brassicae]